MKQDVYFEFVPTIVRKGSPYLVNLNKLILRLLDSGLMLKWEEQVRYALMIRCTRCGYRLRRGYSHVVGIMTVEVLTHLTTVVVPSRKV